MKSVHQWWGATIGANSNDHTYMVEGLTNATALLAQAGSARTGRRREFPLRLGSHALSELAGRTGRCRRRQSRSSISRPSAPLSTLAYGKGALGFLAIRNQIGNDAFIAGLAGLRKPIPSGNRRTGRICGRRSKRPQENRCRNYGTSGSIQPDDASESRRWCLRSSPPCKPP